MVDVRRTHEAPIATSCNRDLAGAVTPGSRAYICLIGKDHDSHACLSGMIAQVHDTAPIDKFWRPIISVWYPGGKTAPKPILLVLGLEDAAICASAGRSLNLSPRQSEPDPGVHMHVTF